MVGGERQGNLGILRIANLMTAGDSQLRQSSCGRIHGKAGRALAEKLEIVIPGTRPPVCIGKQRGVWYPVNRDVGREISSTLKSRHAILE